MITTTLLTVAPRAIDWSPTIGITMVICNIVAIAIAKATMKNPSAGPSIPAGNMFGGFGIPAIIGSTCFGHVLGAGVILGLSNMGVL